MYFKVDNVATSRFTSAFHARDVTIPERHGNTCRLLSSLVNCLITTDKRKTKQTTLSIVKIYGSGL